MTATDRGNPVVVNTITVETAEVRADLDHHVLSCITEG